MIFNEPLLWDKQLNCMFSVVNFEPCMNVLHCSMSVTYTFKNMLLFKEVHIIQYSILACYV